MRCELFQVPTIVKQLSKGRSAEETQLLTEQAITVGWAIEVLQAAFLTIDDIMDGSSTRRGRPCYYTLVGDGAAINDGLILESLVFRASCPYSLTCSTTCVEPSNRSAQRHSSLTSTGLRCLQGCCAPSSSAPTRNTRTSRSCFAT